MPPRTADANAPVRREYTLRTSRRVPNLIVAAVLVGVGVSFVRLGDDPGALTFAFLFVVAGLIVALSTLRSRLTLDGDRLELRSALRTRTVRRDAIDGLQRISNRYGTSTRLYLKNDRGVVTVSGDFTGNDDLDGWLDGLPDIDERNAARIEQMIDREAGAGLGSHVHEQLLAGAKRWMIRLSAAAVVACVAVAVPYRPIAAAGWCALAILTPLGIFLLHRFPLLFTILKAKVDPRADLSVVVLAPGFGIVLSEVFGSDPTHLVDASRLMTWYVPVVVAFFASLAAIAWKSPARWAGVFLVPLFGAMYAVGLVNAADTVPDESNPSFFRTWVVRKHEVHHSRSTSYDLRVAPWGPFTYAEDISVPTSTYDRSAVGDPVCVGLHGGFLHAPWYEMVSCTGPVVRDAALSVPTTPDEASALLADAQLAAARHRSDAHAQFVLGRCFVQLKRFDEALPPLLAAERLDSTDAWTHNSIGWVLNQQRRFDLAVPHLRAAVALDSTYRAAQHNLAWAYFRLGDLPDAEKTYRIVVQLDPESAAAAQQYALVLEQVHGASGAEEEIGRALRLEPNNGGIQATAGYLFRTHARFADARQHFEAASRLLPNSASVWAELAATEYLMNDSKAAAAAFARSIQLDSTYVRSRSGLLEMWRNAAPADAK